METLIELIHASPIRCSLAVTGAGGSAISQLLAVSGCSRTLITADVPYHQDALRLYTDHQCPGRFLSTQVAIDLAHHAHAKTKTILCGNNNNNNVEQQQPTLVGVGCTAAVRTDRSRRGEDGAYIAVWWCDRSGSSVDAYRLLLDKELTRAQQEQKISAAILFALSRCDADVAAKVPADVFLAEFGLSLSVKGEQQQHAGDDDDDESVNLLHQQSFPVPQQLAQFPLSMIHQKSNINDDDDDDDGNNRRGGKVIINAHGVPRIMATPFSEENVDPQQADYLLLVGSSEDQKMMLGMPTTIARICASIIRREGGTKKSIVVTRHTPVSTRDDGQQQEAAMALLWPQQQYQQQRVAFTPTVSFDDLLPHFKNHFLCISSDDESLFPAEEAALAQTMNLAEQCGCIFILVGRRREGKEESEVQRALLLTQAVAKNKALFLTC